MTTYALAQISIHDRERYDAYASKFMDVLTAYDGRLLAADEKPDVVEGEWAYEKVVLMSFKDRAAFDAWATSAEYQEIAKDRIAGSKAVVIVAQGF
ncbi:DUF1330 domain-containing protein [Actinomadura sp. 9N407]|uniref:DUF1330 domain-containing protein n=1 Tax=Actinomadura sp. 9N407 TaxID=3375154 RepID=UPI00379ACDFC